MTKRYQVFVSSTYQDLSEERLEVIKALLELDCIPCGMEYFPAASEDAWSYIANLIEQCDYYVVIVGGRYGSLTPEGISFTQKEFLHAVDKGVPCVAFIHSAPGDLPAKKTEATPEGRQKLSDFIALLRKNLCKDWTTVHELGAVVSRSITQLIKRNPRTGWLPADQASSKEVTEELLELTRKIGRLEAELAKERRKSDIDMSELADGDEEIDIDLTFSVARSAPKDWRGYEVVEKKSTTLSLTWNEIFRTISPRIAPVATDASIRNGINTLLEGKLQSLELAIPNKHWVSGALITTGALDLIRVQFLALGLITVGKERNEEGRMSTVLWRLTDRGEAKMMSSLAVKSKHRSQNGLAGKE